MDLGAFQVLPVVGATDRTVPCSIISLPLAAFLFPVLQLRYTRADVRHPKWGRASPSEIRMAPTS